MRNRFTHFLVLTVLFSSGLAIWGSPSARAAQPMEEIVVTATRREASLEDVPVSVSVVSGEKIRNQALQNLDDLSNWVPGLSVREGGEQTGISIRGFGAGLNFGFDQSVGLFIDGVYAGRERQFRARFLDIENVQVLRGTQDTLFGKNTTTGAVIIQTGQPKFDFDGNITAELGMGVEPRQQVQGFVTGGLTDNIAGRLAVRYSSDDGYQTNTYTGDDEEQIDDWTVRPTFLWTPGDNTNVRLKLEHSKYERTGRYFQVSDVGGPYSDDTTIPYANGTPYNAASTLAVYLAYDPKFEYGLNRITSKQRETADVDSDNIALEITHEMKIGTFKSITGYSAYDSNDQRDVDWTPTTYLYEPITQDFSQVSQEFQFVSALGEKFDYIAGLFYRTTSFYVDRRTDINIEPFLLIYGVSPGDDIIFGGPADNWRYAQLRFLDQNRDDYSIYGQATYHFTPKLDLTLGLRRGYEKKTADDRYFLSQYGRTEFLQIDQSLVDYVRANPDVNFTTDAAKQAELINLANAAGGDALKIANVCTGAPSLCNNMTSIIGNSRLGGGKVSEDDWSPAITVSWNSTENVMLYGKWARGHVGGGFNSQAVGQDTKPTFEAETIDSYEIGAKLRFYQGFVNLDVFRMDFDNLQTSVWTGNEFDVGNAGKSFSQGLEVEGRWLATERLELNGSFIWDDARFDENSGNACTVPQLNFGAPGCVGSNGLPPSDPNATGPFFYDLTGRRFAPLFQGNIGIGYNRPLTANTELMLRADATYFGDQQGRDPTIAQPAVTLVDLRADVRSIAGPWRVGILVKNATGKEHWWYEFEAPAQPGTRIGFLAPPRTVSIHLSYDLR